MKSETCFGKISGQPLSVYFTEFEAQSCADYSNEVYDNKLVPYQCNKCRYWHLSPKQRVTPSQKCDWCIGSDGSYKDTYRNKAEAKTRARIRFEEDGVELKVYKCKYGNGWHLTKRIF